MLNIFYNKRFLGFLAFVALIQNFGNLYAPTPTTEQPNGGFPSSPSLSGEELARALPSKQRLASPLGDEFAPSPEGASVASPQVCGKKGHVFCLNGVYSSNQTLQFNLPILSNGFFSVDANGNSFFEVENVDKLKYMIVRAIIYSKSNNLDDKISEWVWSIEKTQTGRFRFYSDRAIPEIADVVIVEENKELISKINGFVNKIVDAVEKRVRDGGPWNVEYENGKFYFWNW